MSTLRPMWGSGTLQTTLQQTEAYLLLIPHQLACQYYRISVTALSLIKIHGWCSCAQYTQVYGHIIQCELSISTFISLT